MTKDERPDRATATLVALLGPSYRKVLSARALVGLKDSQSQLEGRTDCDRTGTGKLSMLQAAFDGPELTTIPRWKATTFVECYL